MSPVAALRLLDRRDYITLLIVTAVVCAALGFAGALLETGHGQAQGTGTAVTGTVTDALHLTRGDP